MTNWAALKHAYGPADDLPAILEALSPEASDPAWSELWGRVCHQGSVYSASAPVLPHLLALALAWQARDRMSPLSLAGCITISTDRSPDFDIEPYRQDVASLAELARATLAVRGLPRVDFIYLLMATLALEGDELWGTQLDRLEEGEFEGSCPACDESVLIAVGQYGFFVATEDWVRQPGVPRNAIEPGQASALEGVGARLHGLALAADQAEVATWLRHVFGHATCTACDQRLAVAEAIAKDGC